MGLWGKITGFFTGETLTGTKGGKYHISKTGGKVYGVAKQKDDKPKPKPAVKPPVVKQVAPKPVAKPKADLPPGPPKPTKITLKHVKSAQAFGIQGKDLVPSANGSMVHPKTGLTIQKDGSVLHKGQKLWQPGSGKGSMEAAGKTFKFQQKKAEKAAAQKPAEQPKGTYDPKKPADPVHNNPLDPTWGGSKTPHEPSFAVKEYAAAFGVDHKELKYDKDNGIWDHPKTGLVFDHKTGDVGLEKDGIYKSLYEPGKGSLVQAVKAYGNSQGEQVKSLSPQHTGANKATLTNEGYEPQYKQQLTSHDETTTPTLKGETGERFNAFARDFSHYMAAEDWRLLGYKFKIPDQTGSSKAAFEKSARALLDHVAGNPDLLNKQPTGKQELHDHIKLLAFTHVAANRLGESAMVAKARDLHQAHVERLISTHGKVSDRASNTLPETFGAEDVWKKLPNTSTEALRARYNSWGSVGQKTVDAYHDKLKSGFDQIQAVRRFTSQHDAMIRSMEKGKHPIDVLIEAHQYDKKENGLDRPSIGTTMRHSIAGVAMKSLADFHKTMPPETNVQVVHRGIKDLGWGVFSHFLTSDTLGFDATSSTSRQLRTALNFSNLTNAAQHPPPDSADKSHGKYKVLFSIKHKSGKSIEHVSEIPDEHEILLGKGTKYRVTNRTRVGADGLHLEMEEV